MLKNSIREYTIVPRDPRTAWSVHHSGAWIPDRKIDDWLHTPSKLIICFRTEFCQLWYKNKTSNTKVSIQNVSKHITAIPIDLKDNNDPFTLHFRFHCYTRFVFVTSVISYDSYTVTHTLITHWSLINI